MITYSYYYYYYYYYSCFAFLVAISAYQQTLF